MRLHVGSAIDGDMTVELEAEVAATVGDLVTAVGRTGILDLPGASPPKIPLAVELPRTGQLLPADQTLWEAGVRDGDLLIVTYLAVA